MIAISNYQKKDRDKYVPEYPVFSSPVVIEGADLIEALCPVSEFTGKRTSIIDVLSMSGLDTAKQALLGQVLQELPVDASSRGMSDEDLLNMVVPRLASGTPSEDDAIRSSLSRVVADLRSQIPSVASPDDKNTISFGSPELSQVSSE